MTRPLEGKTVVVTRPSHQAEALALPLRELGARVELIPALEIQACDDGGLREAIARLDEFDWLIATSVNGANVLGEEARRQNKSLDTRTLQVAAVGPGTGDAMVAAGAPARYIPASFSSKDLAERVVRHMANCRVLLVQGTSAPNTLADALFAAGARVERVNAYRAMVPAALAKQVGIFFGMGKCADAVTFTSGQIALNFFRALEMKKIHLPESTVIASIGPVTTQALERIGYSPAVEAKAARMDELAAALGEFFRSQG